MKADPFAPIGMALISLLLILLCWRVWGFGIAHTDDAVWALEAHQRHADTVMEWARSQGRLWAVPIGNLMLHALRWQGTLYGEVLRLGSFSLFFFAFHLVASVYCGRTIALLSASLVLGLFVVTVDGSVLITYPLLIWPSATAFCAALLLGRRYVEKGSKIAVVSAAFLLFVSLFNNEGVTVLFCCVFALAIWANDRQIPSSAREGPGPLRHRRTIGLVMVLCGAALLYFAASISWSFAHSSHYDGHVMGSFRPSKFGPVLLSFASANTILSWFFRPYDIVFSDRIGGFGTHVYYGLRDAVVGLGGAPVAVVVGAIVCALLLWLASRLRNRTYFAPPAGAVWAIAIGLAFASVHLLPVSLTSKYQLWHFNQGVLGYPFSLLAHFGLCLALAGVIAGVQRRLWHPLSAGLGVAIAIFCGGLAAAGYRASDQIIADMRPETGRWRVAALMLSGLDRFSPTTEVVYAPRLASGSWHVAVPESYWTEYLSVRYRRALTVKTSAYGQEDILRGLITVDYMLLNDERSFAVTLARHRTPPAGEKQADMIEAVAVGMERATTAQLARYVLAFRNGRNVSVQIPLLDLPASPDGSWRVAANLDAQPGSVRLQQGSQITQPRVICGDELEGDVLITFGTAVASDGPHCEGNRFLGAGWGAAEAAGTWTVDDAARLRLPTHGLPDGDLEAVVNASSFTGLGFSSGVQKVSVNTGGETVASWSFEPNHPVATRFRIPGRARRDDGMVEIALSIAKPMQPSAEGISPDQRRLGLHLCSVFLRPAGQTGVPLPRSSCPTDRQ